MPYKNWIKYSLITGVNVVLFYYLHTWFQSSIHWESLKKAILYIPREAILLALTMGIIQLLFYGSRLSYLIDKGFKSSFWIVCYGFGANNILPFRIGDILKIYFARKFFNVSATKLFFVKVMEKFFDLLLLFFIGIGALFFGAIVIGKTPLVLVSTLLLVVFGISIIGMVLIRRDIKWMVRLRNYGIINHCLSMFEEVVSNPSIKKAMGVTVIIWMITVVIIYVYYKLALPDFKIGWNDAFALVFVTTLSLGIPSTPGGIGVFEAAAVFYLTKFLLVPAEQALATAVVLHLLFALPQIILMMGAIVATRGITRNFKSDTPREHLIK